METKTPALRRQLDQVPLDPNAVFGGRRTDPHGRAITQNAVDRPDRSRCATHGDILRSALVGPARSATEWLSARAQRARELDPVAPGELRPIHRSIRFADHVLGAGVPVGADRDPEAR